MGNLMPPIAWWSTLYIHGSALKQGTAATVRYRTNGHLRNHPKKNPSERYQLRSDLCRTGCYGEAGSPERQLIFLHLTNGAGTARHLSKCNNNSCDVESKRLTVIYPGHGEIAFVMNGVPGDNIVYYHVLSATLHVPPCPTLLADLI